MRNFRAYKYVVGIDEVGRGPIAGPLAIGAVMWSADLVPKKIFAGVKDSKKLSLKKRQEWLKVMEEEKRNQNLNFSVSFVSEKVIDKRGLSFSLKLGIARSLKKLSVNGSECLILLDGGLKASMEYLHQETIIKGDEKEPIISLASIVAKIARDKRMIRLSIKYPDYGFEAHKGYGTKKHYRAIQKHNISPIHRKSFLSSLTFIK